MNRFSGKRILCISLVVMVTAFFSVARAQYDTVLNTLDTRYPQEKLYLHFDRSFYNPGETIWFKVYIFAANMPSLISKTVYADLIDDKGKIIDRKIAPVEVSSAAASFDLPANLTSSHVYIKAYTDWMLNFDSSFLYVKAIPVIQEKPATVKKSAPKNFLQFFPEGGDMVQGVESRVAFKATDIRGLPYKVSGDILDSKGTSVVKFSTMHNGMGFFTLKPASNEQYKASWKDASGKAQVTPLPDARKNGFALTVTQDASGVRFMISRPEGESPYPTVTIVGQIQQQMVYMANANVSKGPTVGGVIPIENLPAGILQLTIFSPDKKPLAERIVFVNKQDYYFITDLNGPLKSFEKRKKNVIQVDVPDTIRTNLSISVTDATLNPHVEGEDDIYSNVLLTSDIKGYVHNPAYYFSSEADSVRNHLDLVMMTNGWRRFKWEEVLAGKFPATPHQPADYMVVNGKINGLNKTELINKELTAILEVNKRQEFLQVPVSNDGTFSISGLLFFDTAKLYYQFNNDKDKILTSRANFDIRNNLLKGPFSLKYDTNLVYRSIMPPKEILAGNIALSEKNMAVLDARRKVQTLESVTVTARQKSKTQILDEQYATGLFAGGDAYSFDVSDDISAQGAMSVLNYLQGRVAGLQITGMGTQAQMSWRGSVPQLYLNEMQSDVSFIQNLNMADVAYIKVFRPPFFGSSGGGAGGAIAVYTKKGTNVYNPDVKGLDFASIPGYNSYKEFYSPDYSKYDERHTEGDYRATLYWNPFVLTDKTTRRQLFTFYNNDVTKRFRIVIEGCDEQGRLTRIEKIFE
ncbi:MAG: hypothetical protein JNK79_19125 [Chitinophagaceae bacterium]|nr:hypothetical protein [Chitinophagaceae bacterium]